MATGPPLMGYSPINTPMPSHMPSFSKFVSVLTVALAVVLLVGCAATGSGTGDSAQERGDLDFHLLMAEIARERGQYQEAARHYRDAAMLTDDASVAERAVLFAERAGLNEVGLDPGLDHMSAMRMIRDVVDSGGRVTGFWSCCGGLPSPEAANNPWRYKFTWNPRNVAMAGEQGAQYLDKDKIKIVPWHNLFHHSWLKEVKGFGPMEAYPNRDSLAYRDKFGLDAKMAGRI